MSNERNSSVELSRVERSALENLIEIHGEPVALERIQISRNALYRCLAGRPVRRGTAKLVRIAIAEIPVASLRSRRSA